MSAEALISVYAVGAAGLALWVLGRFPNVGPRRLVATLLGLVAGWLSMAAAGALFDRVAALGRFGAAAAMLLLVLPALTIAFWAAGCLLRSLLSLIR